MQDQAALGPEAGLAVPAGDGGVDLYVSTQWLHMDRTQIAPCLGLPEELVRVTLAGVGGSFGSREDIHMHIHACLLALRTGRPVKMSYGREESFHGHVHRHPSRTWIRYGATREGRLVAAEVRLLLDGGAYASSSPAVVANASTFAAGPYEVPNVRIEGTVVYTNNPPCGAMRGFGAPQVCFALRVRDGRARGEARARPDRAAARERASPRLGAADRAGARREHAGPRGDRALRRDPAAGAGAGAAAAAAAPTRRERQRQPRRGAASAASASRVGFKNVAYSEGFDDAAEATVTLDQGADGPVAGVHTAAVDFGQGLYTVLTQIVRSELGVDDVVVHPADTRARLGRLDLGLAPDDDERRRGARGLPARPRGAAPPRRRPLARPDLVHRRIPPPADRAASTPTGRATSTSPSRSSPSGPWSRSTRSSGSCAWSRSRPRRTSAG